MLMLQKNHRFARLSRRVLPALAGGLLLCLAARSATGLDQRCPYISGGNLTIPHGCTYRITGVESYTDVEVRNGGCLELAGGAVLSVRDTVVVRPNGEFTFNATTGSQPILWSAGYPHTGNLSISGLITITGSLGGRIDRVYARTVTLESDGVITSESGPLVIAAPLANEGVIRATGSSTSCAITITAAPSAGSTGRFESAEHDNARMVFGASAGLTFTGGAHFDVRRGGMVFNDDVETNGGFRMLSGVVMVAAGKSFKATGAFVAP